MLNFICICPRIINRYVLGIFLQCVIYVNNLSISYIRTIFFKRKTKDQYITIFHQDTLFIHQFYHLVAHIITHTVIQATGRKHHTDRFLGEGDNLPMLKQASTLLLTTRRIPQLYYGTEVMMNGVKSKSDGYVRKDFPGGWTGDATNALTPAGRTKIQNECYDFYKTILNWRKGNDVIAKGSMVQFMVQNGVYAYARQYEGKTIFVMLNGTDAETTVPLKFYKEILKDSKQGKDILSGKAITFGEELKMGPRESLVIEL